MLKLDAKLIQAAGSFELLAQNLMEGYIQGLHRSPFKGSSQEFANYRPYQYGDSVRSVDWKLWGRSDQYFVREYEQETNFCGHLFLDTSKSMDYGDDGENKFLYARLLCSVFTLMMARQKDAPGLALLDGSSIHSTNWLPPSTRRDSIDHLLYTLETLKAEGVQDQLGDTTGFIQESKNRSLAIIITDGYLPSDQMKEFLENLQAQGSEVLFFHILHPDEVEPKFEGDMLLVDSENKKEIPIDGIALRDIYQEKFEAFTKEIETICHDTETDYHRLVTDQPLDEALQAYLQKRGEL